MVELGGVAPLIGESAVVLTSHCIAGVDVLTWQPESNTSAGPVVIAMHGGGFVVGNALGAERIAVPLARDHGITTISVEYRLAPEHPAPAALEDCWAVLAAVADGVDDDLDASRVAVHGSSAGAALAAGLALRARDEGIHLRLQSLSCPALDHRLASSTLPPGHSMTGWSPTWSRAANDAVWRHYLGEHWDAPPAYCVPAIASDLTGVAPAYLIVAEHDVLRDEALAYTARLREAHVPVHCELVTGAVHGFDGLVGQSRISQQAISAQVNALAHALTTN